MLGKIIALSLISAIILLYLKNTASEYFSPVLIVSSLLILSFSIGYVVRFIELFNKIKELTGINSEIFTIIFKVLAISYLIEFSAGVICDMGLNSLAEKVVLCGKFIVLCLVVPVIEQIINLLISLL